MTPEEQLQLLKFKQAQSNPSNATAVNPELDQLMKLKQAQDAAAAKAQEPSPYDTWGGTMTQIGKILGSGLEQAGTGIVGLPAQIADTTNAGLEMLPESVKPYAGAAIRAFNPAVGISQVLRSAGAPSAGEMDQYLRDKGLQHTPENAYEDWAQYLTSAAAQGAIPIGQGATVANMAKGALTSLLPAAAGKGVGELTNSPTAGLIASMLTGLGQHGVASVAKPEVDVAKQLGSDIGADGVPTLREYERLGVPAMTADVIPETSQSATATRNAVAHYPEKAGDFVTALLDRSKNAATRLQQYFTEGAGVDITPDAHVASITKAADDVVSPLHNDIRSSDLTVNVSKVLKDVIPYTRGASVKPSLLQTTMDTVKKHLLKKNEAGVMVPNNQAQAAFAAREFIEKQVAAHPQLEEYLRPIYKKLNGALSFNYPGLIDADNAKAFAEMRKKAVAAGQKAATSGAAEDVESVYSGFAQHPKGDILQQDFKIGYSGKVKQDVQKTSVAGKPSTAVNATGQGKELTDIYGPDLAQKRDFEIQAGETKRKYAVAPDAKGDIVERIRHTPGYGFGALTGLLGTGAAGLGLAGNSTLAALSGAGALTSGAIGLTKILREPKLAKAWLKAAGIKDSAELEKFLLKAQEHGTYGGSAARAGLVNAISNYGR